MVAKLKPKKLVGLEANKSHLKPPHLYLNTTEWYIPQWPAWLFSINITHWRIANHASASTTSMTPPLHVVMNSFSSSTTSMSALLNLAMFAHVFVIHAFFPFSHHSRILSRQQIRAALFDLWDDLLQESDHVPLELNWVVTYVFLILL